MSKDTAIGKRIRQLRKMHGLSIVALAAKSKVDKAVISRIETGKRSGKDIKVVTLRQLAHAFGCTCDEIVLGPVRPFGSIGSGVEA